MEGSSNKPVRVFRSGMLSASVFANDAKDGSTFHKVSLQRTYADGEQLKSTTSLGRDDLPASALLLERAWAFVCDAEAEKKSRKG